MGYEKIAEYENKIKTKMGATFAGERVVYRGLDLHHQLADMDWMEFYLLGITGKRYSKPVIELLNFFWVCTSYPDPRIWNNRIVSFAGTKRSTGTQALSAGLMSSEARIFGHRLSYQGVEFFLRLVKAMDEGAEVEQFVKNEMKTRRYIPGYGRPMGHSDERVPAAIEKIEKLGLARGRHYELCFEVERIVRRNWRMKMNIITVGAAMATEIGFSPMQYLMFMYPCFLAGMTTGYLEALENPEGSFLPIRCENLRSSVTHDRKKWVEN